MEVAKELNHEHLAAFKRFQEAATAASAAEVKAREALKEAAEVETRAHAAKNEVREVQLRLTATAIGMLRHIILTSIKKIKKQIIVILQKNQQCNWLNLRKRRANCIRAY